jgi:hypothetical protein
VRHAREAIMRARDNKGKKMTTTQRGIPTKYKGITFRSRVEAKWAVMFDELGWGWEYEPLDLNGYIPDFALMFKEAILVEVKSELTLASLGLHKPKLDRVGAQEYGMLLVGATPIMGYFNKAVVMGWSGLPYHFTNVPRERYAWDYGVWATCVECGAHYIKNHNDDNSVGFCGHVSYSTLLRETKLQSMWASAIAQTTWRPPRRGRRTKRRS